MKPTERLALLLALIAALIAGPAFTSYHVLPAGTLLMSTANSCPAGFSEATALNGKTVVGTLAANSDVGSTGGSASITPSGTVSAPTFTGTPGQSTSAVSAGTPAGTNGTTSCTFTGTKMTTSGSGTPAATAACGTTLANGSNTINFPAPTFTGTALGTHSHTLTPAGTVSAPSFTGDAFDPHPPFVKLIFCQAN